MVKIAICSRERKVSTGKNFPAIQFTQYTCSLDLGILVMVAVVVVGWEGSDDGGGGGGGGGGGVGV